MKELKHPSFISKRISKLNTAIFENDSRSLLRLTTAIVCVSHIDKHGSVWFKVKSRYSSRDEQRFPARLHFYNKKYNYSITAEGIATVTNTTPVEVMNAMGLVHLYDLSICFQVKNTEYRKGHWVEDLLTQLEKWADILFHYVRRLRQKNDTPAYAY